MKPLERIEQEIQHLRDALRTHPMYSLLSDIDDVRIFMEKHVYAVWDFMSLLKSLQLHFTCTSLPWMPKPNAKLARFINEIVHGEESDINELGIPKSHFEMYLDAMEEVNADTSIILNFISEIKDLSIIHTILKHSDLGEAEKRFLSYTFNIIKTEQPHKIAAAFTFGREDLIPDMFIAIIEQSNSEHKNLFPKLTYYLERHIEVDGDEHGPLALEMIQELCGDDQRKWDEVLIVAKESLRQRILLWDAIAKDIKEKKMETVLS